MRIGHGVPVRIVSFDVDTDMRRRQSRNLIELSSDVD
jgi:hypothetical protein